MCIHFVSFIKSQPIYALRQMTIVQTQIDCSRLTSCSDVKRGRHYVREILVRIAVSNNEGSFTQSVDIDEDSHQTLDHWYCFMHQAWAFKGGFCAYAIITKILCAGFMI